MPLDCQSLTENLFHLLEVPGNLYSISANLNHRIHKPFHHRAKKTNPNLMVQFKFCLVVPSPFSILSLIFSPFLDLPCKLQQATFNYCMSHGHNSVQVLLEHILTIFLLISESTLYLTLMTAGYLNVSETPVLGCCHLSEYVRTILSLFQEGFRTQLSNSGVQHLPTRKESGADHSYTLMHSAHPFSLSQQLYPEGTNVPKNLSA